MQELFIELLQVTLDLRDCLSRVPSSKEWFELYKESSRQAVVGIAFEGVQKLPDLQRPPQRILFEWIGLSEQIRQHNKVFDRQTSEIWNQLKEDGLDVAVLKGQGIASLYRTTESGNHGTQNFEQLRQSGDIDVWVLGGYQKVCDYVQRTHPTNDVAYHRFHYDYFKDTEVELHHRPTLMRNLLDDRKLARWYNNFKADDFVYLEEKGFAVPPASFNVIFILTHIYRHFLFEGIGLRQVMDYYFVLRSIENEESNIENYNQTLKELRLERFAEAMMWILHSQFGLEEKFLICGMNEKEGKFVLKEILMTGNFGQADTRYRYKRLFKLRHHLSHGSHLLMHYPSEVIWTPIWLMYHKIWKWNKKRKIRKNRI